MSVKQFISKVLGIPNQIYNKAVLAYRHVQYGRNLKINGRIYCVSNTKGGIQIGDNVRINSSMGSNPIGGSTRTILFAKPNARIQIGNNVGISNSTLFAASGITVEDDVLIGGDCCIYDTNFHSVPYDERILKKDCNVKISPVTIQAGAFIGAHSVVLKGVTVGKRSVIAAGSVVTRDVPSDEVWGGNPARFIKRLDDHAYTKMTPCVDANSKGGGYRRRLRAPAAIAVLSICNSSNSLWCLDLTEGGLAA